MLGAILFLKCFWHHFLAQGKEEIFFAFFHLCHFLYLSKFFKEDSNPTELEGNSIDESLHHPSCFLHRQPSSFPKPQAYSFLLCLTLHPQTKGELGTASHLSGSSSSTPADKCLIGIQSDPSSETAVWSRAEEHRPQPPPQQRWRASTASCNCTHTNE